MTSVQPGDRVTTYSVGVSCPSCGGDLTHCASGTPGMDTRAVARCEPCRRHWGVVVQLVDVTAELVAVKDRAAEYQREKERRERRKAVA